VTKPKKSPAKRRGKPDTLSLYLGEEIRDQLTRCRVLLGEREPGSTIPCEGLTVRIAVRRLLLSLLGERANPSDPEDQVMREYLELYSTAFDAGELPVAPDKFGESETPAPELRKVSARKPKGGVE